VAVSAKSLFPLPGTKHAAGTLPVRKKQHGPMWITLWHVSDTNLSMPLDPGPVALFGALLLVMVILARRK
jgi:hypothetical protein